MDKLGICQWCVHSNLLLAIETARCLGYEGVSIDTACDVDGRPILDETARKIGQSYAEDNHIEITTIAMNELCQKSSWDGVTKSYEIDALDEQAVEIAVSMGIPKIQVPAFVKSAIQTEENFLDTVKHLKRLCRLAEAHNIMVMSENALTAQENIRLVNLVEKDNFSLLYDTANLHMSSLNGPEVLNEIKEYIWEVHLKDMKYDPVASRYVFAPLGTGDVNLPESVRILKSSNFSGWYHNENTYSIEDYKRDILYCKNL